MNVRNLKSVHGVNLVSAFALAVVLLATSGLGAQEDRWESQERGLEGTWRVQVSVKDCQTGAVQRSFPALLAFVKGGTVTQATAGQPPPLFTNGIGVWRHTGRGTYTAVIEAFAFNPAGVWISTHRFTRTIELDRGADEFTDTIKLEILDTSGNLIAPGCGSSTARRFE
ncbi:hypothetical protein [Edaphobacter aggregans]|uniref:hypothetical protein n=1 Tax=Edaphobacter aggregans TaxID=570835 RepID=UPI0005582F93|nr:hypothetical protein [Edaphobacter aggregans]